MSTFLTLALSFPTAIFTTLLLVLVLYWALVLTGAFGLDFGHDGALEAKAGALEAKGAALEGALDAKSGALEGAVEAKSGLLEGLGFGVVPGSIVVTFLVFWSWTLSMTGSYFLGPLLGGFLPVWAGGSAIALGAMFVSVFLSTFSVKPLRPLFEIKAAPRRRQLLGRIATVSSGRVDQKFGTATMEDGGAGLQLHVFCANQNALKKGDQVLVLDYSADQDAYEVEPVQWLLPDELKQLENPLAAEAIARARLKERVGG